MCTSIISCIGHGHAAEVCADTEHHEPLGLLDARRVRGGVPQFGHIDIVGRGNVLLRAVADEHGLATPFDRNGGADGDGANVNLGGAHGQRVGGRRPLGHAGAAMAAARQNEVHMPRVAPRIK